MSPAAADEGARPERSRRRKGDAAKDPKGRRKDPPAKRRPKRRSNPLGRLRAGEAIYLVAAILLFVLMFFQWYGHQHSGPNSELVDLQLFGGGTAWQTLEVIPLFLMLAIVVAVGSAVLRLAGSDWKPAIPPAATVCVLGLLAAALILFRIISPPGIDQLEGVPIERSLEIGIFLALAAALGIAYGGWRAMADEGTSFGGVAKRLESPRPAPKKSATAKKRPTAPKSATASDSIAAKKSGTGTTPASEPESAAAKKPTSPRRSPRKKS